MRDKGVIDIDDNLILPPSLKSVSSFIFRPSVRQKCAHSLFRDPNYQKVNNSQTPIFQKVRPFPTQNHHNPAYIQTHAYEE